MSAQDKTSSMTAWAKRAIKHVSALSSGSPLTSAAQITINFQPDALHGGQTMIEALARDGVYRSQFETGTSNGALSAHQDTGRLGWESRIFDGAYDSADAALRPKYGALNHCLMTVGGSPRFGSAHLRLAPGVLTRTTFCFPDSHMEPKHFGVASQMGLLDHLWSLPDPLDNYVEAHVHGTVDLSKDVSALVLDPSFRDTAIEAAARKLECPIKWHAGFAMTRSKLADCKIYRGDKIAELAASLFTGETLTPACIAKARQMNASGTQDLKRVWHCVARFGSPDPFPQL